MNLIPTTSPLAALREGAATADQLTANINDRRQEGLVNKLYAQSYGQGPQAQQAARAEAAQLGPGATAALGKAQTGDRAMQEQEIVKAARFLAALPGDQRGGAYAQLRPQLEQVLGSQLSPEYDEDVDDVVEAVIEAYGPGTGDDLKSLRVGQDGNFYAIQGGQLVNTGVRAAQNLRPLDLGANGFVGFDPRTGQAAPVTAGGQQPAPQQPTRFRDSTGGVLDISQVEDPQQRAAIIANPELFGLAAETGASVELPAREVAQFSGGAGSTGAPIRKVEAITPYQQAQLGATARDDYRADRSLQLQEEQAAQKLDEQRREADEAKRGLQRAAQGVIDTTDDALSTIKRLRSHPGYTDLGTPEGDAKMAIPLVRTQVKGAKAILDQVGAQSLINTLSALKAASASGASGFGSLTEKEGAALTAAMGNLTTAQSHEDIDANLAEIERILTRTQGAARDTARARADSAPAAPAAADPDIADLLEKYR